MAVVYPTYPVTTLAQAEDMIIFTGNQIHDIMNADATSVIEAEDGQIPSIRKAFVDNMYFKSPQIWVASTQVIDPLQLKRFTDGGWYFAPTATASTPVNLGATPIGDTNWKSWNKDQAAVYQHAKRLAAEAGYNMVSGSFYFGGTLNSTDDVLFYEGDGKYYSWSGAFPKVVSAGSTPETSGGIGAGTWVDRTDATIRSDINIIVKTFNTVSQMQSDASLVVGAKIRTIGYNNLFDGGGTLYEVMTSGTGVDDGGSFIGLTASGLQAKAVFDGVVSISSAQFGILGDGSDETQKIQRFIDYCYYTAKKDAYFAEGSFSSTGINIPCPNAYNAHKLRILGSGRKSTTIKSKLTVVEDTNPRTNTSCYGAVIRGLTIDATTFNYGINIDKPATGFDISDIAIVGFTSEGIHVPYNFWINKLENIFIEASGGSSTFGIRMLASGTTNFFNDIFVYGSTNTAYKLLGGYSTIGCLAADNCSGNYVYDLRYFSGSVGSLGCELANVTDILLCGYTPINIGLLQIFHPTIDDALLKGRPISCLGKTRASIENLRITAASPITSTRELANIFDATLKIGRIDSNVTFASVGANLSSTTSIYEYSGIKWRNGGATSRAYIGIDRSASDPGTQAGEQGLKSTALFLGALGGPWADYNGTNYRYNIGSTAGDFYIEADPLAYNCFGYSVTVTNTDSANANTYKRVPLVLSGTTANRPTLNLFVGLQYFDTTLNIPIWRGNSGWVNASGASV